MSVIAMRITVASTGEIAFLFLLRIGTFMLCFTCVLTLTRFQ
jgi:hypothetical protein